MKAQTCYENTDMYENVSSPELAARCPPETPPPSASLGSNSHNRKAQGSKVSSRSLGEASRGRNAAEVMDGWTDGWMGRWVDDGWNDGQADGLIDG